MLAQSWGNAASVAPTLSQHQTITRFQLRIHKDARCHPVWYYKYGSGVSLTDRKKEMDEACEKISSPQESTASAREYQS